LPAHSGWHTSRPWNKVNNSEWKSALNISITKLANTIQEIHLHNQNRKGIYFEWNFGF